MGLRVRRQSEAAVRVGTDAYRAGSLLLYSLDFSSDIFISSL